MRLKFAGAQPTCCCLHGGGDESLAFLAVVYVVSQSLTNRSLLLFLFFPGRGRGSMNFYDPWKKYVSPRLVSVLKPSSGCVVGSAPMGQMVC